MANLEQKLDETEALLRTNQTHQMHLETDKMRLLKEIQASKIEINSCEKRIGNIILYIVKVFILYFNDSTKLNYMWLNSLILFKRKLS